MSRLYGFSNQIPKKCFINGKYSDKIPDVAVSCDIWQDVIKSYMNKVRPQHESLTGKDSNSSYEIYVPKEDENSVIIRTTKRDYELAFRLQYEPGS